jgi:hypothetical protein
MSGVKSAYETYDVMSTMDYVERLYAESALRVADPDRLKTLYNWFFR